MGPKFPLPKKLPLLLLSDDVLLPGASMRIPITDPRNLELVKDRVMSEESMISTIIGVVFSEPSDTGNPSRDIHKIGTAAIVVEAVSVSWPQPCFVVSVIGFCRFFMENIINTSYPVGVVKRLDTTGVTDYEHDNEVRELVEDIKKQTTKLLGLMDQSAPTVNKLKKMLQFGEEEHLVDLCGSVIHATYKEKLKILDAADWVQRMKIVQPLLKRHISGLEMFNVNNPKPGLTPIRKKPMSETFIRISSNEMKPFSSPVFDNNVPSQTDELDELEKKILDANMPPIALKTVLKELQRLRRMTPLNAETGVVRNYLELCSELPWSKSSSEVLDISKSRKDLDADHYGMTKLKKRVLEYLAVRQLRNNLRGPILCFVGPPGVGKTSVGRSIAQTLGREFHRISLGGITYQSEIRGHRRTYVAAMPGRIIQGLKMVGVKNPVFLLDEVDKLKGGINGDPAAALLEVLDPEQNFSFVDLYLNIPFDLSQVMFIATANTIQTIPAALLDRMEIIHVPGYTREEKLQIGIKHLVPKQLREHGLTANMMEITNESLKTIISGYTQEAGVRSLERKIGALCRSVAVRVAEMDNNGKKNLPIVIDLEAVETILGPAIYLENDLWSRVGQPGVAVGLAWTTVGGELLIVEASKMEGDGELILTGHLGNVMKESAKLALNWIRVAALTYGISLNGEVLSRTDIHIHFPAGGVGKDGPSAGVTIATALVSLFTGEPVASDIAMTGEITLRGIVLPVGGIKEKVLAAHRAGIKRIVLPHKSSQSIHDISDDIKKELTFIFVNQMDEVLNAAFNGKIMPIPEREVHGPLASKL